MKHFVERSAQLLDKAAQEAAMVEQLSTSRNFSLEIAYEIQKSSIERRLKRGELLTGIKLGFTSKAKMDQMGVHELIWGRLTDSMLLKNRGTMNVANYIHPRAEPEIAFQLGVDLDSIDEESTLVEVLSGIAVAIEIIDSRYENFKFSLEDVIADNCSSTGYVLGDWKLPKTMVSNIPMVLSLNGEVAESGNSNAILGNPLKSLAEGIRLAKKHELPLKKGMIILAGAATPAIYLNKGDEIQAEAGVLGNVELTIG